jgi:CubicO group peptidase (beta-lactamase class C family)
MRLLVVAGVLTLASPSYGQQAWRSTFSRPQVEELARAKVEAERRTLGLVIGVVDENGAHVLSRGRCCDDARRVLDGDTVFEIGSLTKPLVQALLADMVRRGEVGMDDPVSRHLPSNVRVPTEGGREITLRHLVEHMSSLPRMPDDYPSTGDDYPAERFYAFLARHELRRPIGSQREYSNIGYGLLALALATRGGKPFEALLRERITGPLGMTRTYIRARPPGISWVASGHDQDLTPQPPTLLGPAVEGAGAVRSTVNDLLKFLSASMGLGGRITASWGQRRDVRGKSLVLHDGSTPGFSGYMAYDPLRRRGVVLLSNSNYVLADVALHLLQPQYPLVPRRARVTLEPSLLDRYVGAYKIGETVANLSRYHDRLFLERPGQLPREVFAEEAGRFFLDDSQPIAFTGDDPASHTMLLFQRDGSSIAAQRVGSPTVSYVDLDAPAFEELVGSYKLSDTLNVGISREGLKLRATITGQDALELLPISALRFRYIHVDAQIEFTRGPNGAIDGLIIHQGGEASRATRSRQG